MWYLRKCNIFVFGEPVVSQLGHCGLSLSTVVLPWEFGSTGWGDLKSCDVELSRCLFGLGSCMGSVNNVGCEVSILVMVVSLKRCAFFRWCLRPLSMIVSHWLQVSGLSLVIGGISSGLSV